MRLHEKYDLVDIWKTRNRFSKRYVFKKNDFSGYIQRCLDYIFISNTLKQSLQQSSILSSFRSFYSPILVSYNKLTQISLVKTFGNLTSLYFKTTCLRNEIKRTFRT